MSGWELNFNKDNEQELTEEDKKHIAESIKKGYTSGELCDIDEEEEVKADLYRKYNY
ncbi:MAG TPA: hypothetical protein VGB37_16490 [Candidatus Lokiarchaeia archaeon]